MRMLLAICSLFILPLALHAQILSGTVRDSSGAVLPFSTLLIKGTTRGVTANAEGQYTLHLSPGAYTVVCEHVGYAKSEKKIDLSADRVLDFQLTTQRLSLSELIIKSTDEDPAYGIIRHTIALRTIHLKELESFQCMVYSKGKAGLYETPKRFMGKKIPTDTNYIGKNTTLYMSEVYARYAESPPDKQRVEVLSTKVSGQSNGYGATIPYIVSFYQNIIDLGNLNPRGFVSPIAAGALHYYKYKLVGTYFEDGRMIDQIKVTPRRAYEPCFTGTINIVDGLWRIHSTDLVLLKTAQLQLLDTFHMQQLYAPLDNGLAGDTGAWVMRSQVGQFAFNLFGFAGGGSVANIYSDFELHPGLPKDYFGNATLQYDKGSNKKTADYWDSIRPVPLTAAEAWDYHKKDSLEKIQSTPRYMDSVDKANNKITPLGLFLTGINISHQRSKVTMSVPPLTTAFGFNTVEGWYGHLNLGYEKRFGDHQALELHPDIRYGFANRTWGGSLEARYRFNVKYASELTVAGGRTTFQYDNADPITPQLNTAYTLFDVANYMKIYEASFGRLQYAKDLGKTGLNLVLGGEFQDRSPLTNTDTSTYWVKGSGKPGFTPNYPASAGPIAPNKALSFTATLNWHPGMKYIEYPESLVPLGSKYPIFTLSYTKGVSGPLGSTADYDKWRLSIHDNINFRIGGLFKYNLAIGGFLNDRNVAFQDDDHFQGNLTLAASPYMNNFQLLPYYAYSNTDRFYAEGHVEHHFAGLLTNKIPLFRQLDWYLVGGVNYLYLSDGRIYTEVSAGLENILNILRVDYLWGLPNNGPQLTGLRIGVKIGP
ncbi:DUF5686 and carboxypeptidase regulatory-like domain-containing protein [Dinghuibacter silviterrae]|uniref:Carboxypeptidase-like protein n=1 Tax=Dinghuibacter silviterrae TaxID=1539049 RepID=A0A4R8DV23_9BACT|nr:DUF5686 and carboxypeptidase regulatory-like domain-containing protein [Dinghuibacter silviterrae]TDX02262.1 carboxypeptidase-like protein [Dinghuibacter silviterrae]